MGRRRGFGKAKKIKVAPFELIDANHKPLPEPYKLLAQVRKDWHPETSEASIALAWRKGWKSDKDGHLKLGQCIKAAELQKEFIDYDFVILLNFEVWNEKEFTKEKKIALLDHELCFPAETSVTGPEVELGIRRWYSGEMIEITTAAGNKLSGTPNHPVLTNKGWVPLGLLNEGDYVVSSRDPERVSAAMDPHKYQTPSSIEDVVRSVPMISGLMPQAAHDFNADLPNGKVDVIRPDRELLLAVVSFLMEHIHQIQLGWRSAIDVSVASLSHLDQGFGRMLLSSPSGMSGVGTGLAFSGSQFSHPVTLGIGKASDGDTGSDESLLKSLAIMPENLLKRLQGLSRGVGFDQIVNRSVREYNSHVFNLQTSQQWYHANGVVVHNCHAGEAVDKEGEPKVDAKGRRMWRIVQHDIQEFHAIVRRHGTYKKDLEKFAESLMEHKQKSLPFTEQKPAEAAAVVN